MNIFSRIFRIYQAGSFAKFFAKITAVIASGALLLSACNDEGETWEKEPNVLTRAAYGAELNFDPHRVRVTTDTALVRDLFVGLMAFDVKGNVIPALARHTLTEDGKHWQFMLNEDAKWSNGEPVTAEDFVASWQRLLDKEKISYWANYLVDMRLENAKSILNNELPISDLGVQAIDERTLQIDLEEPNFQLPIMLTHVALLPTYQGKPPAETFVFNGAYRLTTLEREQAILERQSDEEEQGFESVIYRVLTSAQNPNMFDIIDNPISQDLPNQLELPRLCTYFYEFNFNEPIVGQKSVRQAIRSMISAQEMSYGLGLATHSALPKTMWQGDDRLPMNENAESILAKAGVDYSNVVKVTLTFGLHHLHSTVANRFARLLAQSDLFRVRLQAVENGVAIQKREQQDFQIMPREVCAAYDDPLVFLKMFHSQSPENKSGYGNEEVDQWLDELMHGALVAEQRNQKVIQIIRQLNEDVAILPLFQYQHRIVVDPSIRGVQPTNSSDVIYSKDLFRQTKDK